MAARPVRTRLRGMDPTRSLRSTWTAGGAFAHRLRRGATVEETASSICREAVRVPAVDVAAILLAGPTGAERLAGAGPIAQLPDPTRLASLLPDRLRRTAWSVRRMTSDADVLDELGPGIAWAGLAPIRGDGRIIATMALGSHTAIGTGARRDVLSAASELAGIAELLVGPDIVAHQDRDELRRVYREIIESGAFEPWFQPVVDLDEGRSVGFEALTRFSDGVAPDVRFREAEAIGMGVELELACLRAAVLAGRRLPRGPWLSLNVAPDMVARTPDELAAVLAAADRPLVIEITEHRAIEDFEAFRAGVLRLPLGTRIAVDDAGAGYAGLRQILEVRPHIIKLDLGLVRDLGADLARQAMVVGVRHFALNVGCKIVAEGIETAAELAALRNLGVRYGQGYLLGRPALVGHWSGEPGPDVRRAADPAAPGTAASAEPMESPTTASIHRPATILLVDDEPLVRGLTLEVLRREGFRVEVADDGAEALRFMRDSDLHVDMLVTDLLMPGVGGRELAEHLRRGRPGLPVLFVSGFAGAEDLPEVGPNSTLLAKPFSAAGLVAAVRELLAGSPEVR